MSCNVHLIKTKDFVRLDGHGRPDFNESRRMLEGVARACIERGTNFALLDCRGIQGALSMGDFYNLITAFHDMGFQLEHRLAILHSYNRTEQADFFAMCASTRGWNVRAFEDYEHAIEWFSTEIPVDE